MAVANTQAYYVEATIMAVKSFIVQTQIMILCELNDTKNENIFN
jgi:hypothetical protein